MNNPNRVKANTRPNERKQTMNTRNHRYITSALSLALLLGTPLALAGTTGQMQHQTMEQKAGQTEKGEMPAKCKAMMQKKQQMMQERQQRMMQKCKAMDTRLEELAATMNTATGQQKIDAMAALLNELVQQRKSMHTMMMQMREDMMSGMMGKEGGSSSTHGMMMMKKEMMQQKDTAAANEAGESAK